MTTLKLYYIKLTDADKKTFKQNVIERAGISESSFYRFLEKMPNILTQEVIADIINIEKQKLYKKI